MQCKFVSENYIYIWMQVTCINIIKKIQLVFENLQKQYVIMRLDSRTGVQYTQPCPVTLVRGGH